MVGWVGAVERHLALIGFMGAGKTTVGREVARLTGRPFVDTDAEIERREGPIAQIFEERGEAEFRRLEEALAREALAGDEPAVVALGGGAVVSEATRERLARRAFTVLIEIEVDEAWKRARASGRPLARDEATFRELFAEREELYAGTADAAGQDAEDVLLAALGITVEPGALGNLAGLLAGEWPLALVGDERVLDLHRAELADRLESTHSVPSGEAAKRADVARRLWDELRLGRDGMIVALGGGTTTDVAGFVAATYLRGVAWAAVPTTLLGQVDAGIGGKTGIDLDTGKNLVGAFHFPASVVIDPGLLTTLPAEERRQGMAEIVKTGLLAGRALWELPEEEMVRACAAFKAAVVLSDPYERGRRAILNLGHTFAHALEAASGYTLRHGDAVALGLLAALRLSGRPTDAVEEVLRPEPVRVDPDAAWAALRRDKKSEAGVVRLVLLDGPGRPQYGVEVPDEELRAALEALIARG